MPAVNDKALLSGLQFAHFIPEAIERSAGRVGLSKPVSVDVPMTEEARADYANNSATVRAIHPVTIDQIDALPRLIGTFSVPENVACGRVSIICTICRELSEVTTGGVSILWQVRAASREDSAIPGQLPLF